MLCLKNKKIIFAMGYVVHHPSRSVFETSLLLICVVRTQNIYFLQLISQDLNGEKFSISCFRNFENTLTIEKCTL